MQTLTGTCHCGAVEIEIPWDGEFHQLRRCDCSYCRRRWAVVASVKVGDLAVTKGEDKLTLYQWNTMTARHYFCSVCGIYTHHQRRSFPDQYGYNVGCLEGINPFLLGDVPVSDGVNHPADRASSA